MYVMMIISIRIERRKNRKKMWAAALNTFALHEMQFVCWREREIDESAKRRGTLTLTNTYTRYDNA